MKDHKVITLFFERSEQAITELIIKYGAAIKNLASIIWYNPQDIEECTNDLCLEQDKNIRLGDSTRTEGYQMTTNLLNQKPLPDAIICGNNDIAIGCVDGIRDKGMKIPKDIGVITFDDYPFSLILEPQLTVVDINIQDMGTTINKMMC